MRDPTLSQFMRGAPLNYRPYAKSARYAGARSVYDGTRSVLEVRGKSGKTLVSVPLSSERDARTYYWNQVAQK